MFHKTFLFKGFLYSMLLKLEPTSPFMVINRRKVQTVAKIVILLRSSLPTERSWKYALFLVSSCPTSRATSISNWYLNKIRMVEGLKVVNKK